MPPKRRGAQAKASQPSKQPTDPPKQPADPPRPPQPSSRPAPTAPPAPPPPPPLPQPVESDAVRVRKEWSKFIDVWYEPQKNKLVEKLQKDLLVKYKSLGSPKETQKLREMELFEKLDSIAQQLAQPARTEWERRLDIAQLREDQWDDMSGEEQQQVMSVFVGFFADDIDDMDDDDVSPNPSSIEEDSSVEDPPPKPITPAKHPVPPTPARPNFEFVNPTSFTDIATPSHPSKRLPALSMDHLATLGPSNPARSAEPLSGGGSGMLGFHNWASEVGIVSQQPPPAKSPSPPSTLSARPRATENVSRQPSAASNLSSPPLNPSLLQYSPLHQPTKFSPPINAESLPLGKRYIGPVIEEEHDPMEDEILKSKMADDYQQYKISLRIQMIYQFHAEAADIEIKLVESLLTDTGTKESRARAVQEHESSMMRLRDQKEDERKRLCAEEREKRREEMRQHLVQRRTVFNREVDPLPKPGPPWPDRPSVQQRPGKWTHQKENVPNPPLTPISPANLEPPSIMKSNSTLSQDEASANEALFANAMAMMNQGKASATGLTPAQALSNEAIFSNAAAILATQTQPEINAKNALKPPSIMKKSNSSRLQDYDIPQITVSFAELNPEPAQAPPTATKGKKGKKAAVQTPPPMPITIAEEPETDAELHPPAHSLWDTAAVAAKSVWGAGSASVSASKSRLDALIEDDVVVDHIPTPAPAPPKANVGAKKASPAAKKGKKVTITEEPDVDADPIISPPATSKAKATKGSVNGKSKLAFPAAEESEPEPTVPPQKVTPAWGKKTANAVPGKAPRKPQPKVSIEEEQESEFERGPAPAQKSKAKSAWSVPAATPSAMQTEKKTVQREQAPPRHGARIPGFTSVFVDPEPEDGYLVNAGDATMPGAMDPSESEEVEGEGDTSNWFNPENMSYWDKFMGSHSLAETQAVPEVSEQEGKHIRWTPPVNRESDEEDDGGMEDDLATSIWMQYAISGGNIPALGDPLEEPHFTPSESVQHDTSAWEQGKGTKKSTVASGDLGNRVQQTSVFDRAAFTGQWPKMESWLSPPARGQNSGSTRVF